MNGPEPFAWSEIEAWARQMGEQLEPHEIEALKMMDLASIAGMATKPEV